MVEIKKINVFLKKTNKSNKTYFYDCTSDIGFLKIISETILTFDSEKNNMLTLKDVNVTIEKKVFDGKTYYTKLIFVGYQKKQ